MDEQQQYVSPGIRTQFLSTRTWGWLGSNLAELGPLDGSPAEHDTEIGAVLYDLGPPAAFSRAKWLIKISGPRNVRQGIPGNRDEYFTYFRVPRNRRRILRTTTASITPSGKCTGLDLPDEVFEKKAGNYQKRPYGPSPPAIDPTPFPK